MSSLPNSPTSSFVCSPSPPRSFLAAQQVHKRWLLLPIAHSLSRAFTACLSITMLSPVDLYHSPTAASSRIASRASPSAPLRLAIRPSPSPSSRVLPSQSPSTNPKAVKRSSPVLSTPIVERAEPSGLPKAAAGPSFPRRKLKHSRAAQACDVCRKSSWSLNL